MTWTTRPRSDFPAGISGIVAGEGPPVVLIHGVGLNADSWGAQIDALAKRWRVHALDQPGHGNSVPLAALIEPDRVSDLTDRLAEAVASLGEPVRLAGHSLGALIVLDLAARYPALVHCVAALNGVHRRTAGAQSAVAARAGAMSVEKVHDPTPTLTRWFGDALDSPPAIACRDWLTSVDPVGYKRAYTAFAIGDSPSDEALSGIMCPALFLTGAEEPNSTPAMSEAMAALVPKGRSLVLENAAHMALMTHPESVTEALERLFEEAA